MADGTLPLELPGQNPTPDEQRTASLSNDGTYRWRLARRWDNRPLLPFIMLNPSTADANNDDPTIRRCRGFARDLGYGGFGVLNLYAYRATKPRELFLAHARGIDIVGRPDNDERITAVLAAAHTSGVPVVAAWGANALPARVAEVLAMPRARDVLHHLGLTAAGQPRHPLMLPKSATLTRWEP